MTGNAVSKYIPSPEHWKEMFSKYSFYSVREQIPISEIKVNRALFDFNNEVRHGDVDYMCSNFELDAWMPITVSEKMFLLDGQHRLACAKKLGLKYIDAVVLAEETRLAMRHVDPKPFVKWAGGKRQLIDILLANVPKKYSTYIEPFVGGGALLFALTPKKAIIADINAELINAYGVIKKDVEGLLKSLKNHKNEEDYFYRQRALIPGDLSPLERASRFIYLNKTCFNGLYRENSKGQFNAPYGRYKNPNIADIQNLHAVHRYLSLSKVKIYNQDFIATASMAKEGDFIYFDPPYHPMSATASFTKYSKGDFTAQDQEKLAEQFNVLARRGCYVMLSNSNTDFIKSLYRDHNIVEIEANRFINCKADKRGKGLFEVLIKSW